MKFGKSRMQALVLLALLGTVGQVNAAEEIDVVTNISVGVQNIDLNWTEDNGSRKATKNSSVELRGALIGVTVLDGKWHYGLSTEISGQSLGTLQVKEPVSITDSTSPITAIRSSYSVILGRRLGDSYALYGGYTSGANSFGNERFVESGYFFGARYIMSFSSNASLTVDGAYSMMNTQLSLDGSSFGGAGTGRYSSSGTVSGPSISLTWLRSLNRGRSFYVKLKASTLTHSANGTHETGSVSILGEQKLTAFYFGMGF